MEISITNLGQLTTATKGKAIFIRIGDVAILVNKSQILKTLKFVIFKKLVYEILAEDNQQQKILLINDIKTFKIVKK